MSTKNESKYPLHHEDARPMYVSVLKEEYERMQAESHTGWISVDERLPEKMKDVLCSDGADVFLAHYDEMCDGSIWWQPWGLPHLEGITHWMPLPEPPEGVKC